MQTVATNSGRMTKYNQEYYFIRMKDNETRNISRLQADGRTVHREYRREAMAPGSAPLFFKDAYAEERKEASIPLLDKLPNILFRGVNFLVTSDIHRQLLDLKIPHMATHPAVYMHDDGKWYEDYWFIAFTQRFDCWDREKSIYKSFGDDQPVVGKYSLNEKLLDETPLQERLLFQLDKTADGMIVCHESIKHLFKVEGVQLERVDEF